MTIDKALYSQGIAAEPDLEIEIDNPDAVSIDTGDVEITLEAGQDLGGDFYQNLAEVLDDRTLSSIGSELIALVDADINSRSEWAESYVKGLEVLGLKYEERTEPWNGACGVYSTVLTEAAIRFQAESIMESFPAAGPVKTEIFGTSTKEKETAASRVEEDMNYKITEKMPEYRPEHERMLFGLGLAGSGFKKVYDDPVLGRGTSIYVTAEDIIVPYGASSLRTCERVTHVMRKTKNELRKLQATGFYRDVDLGEPVNIMSDIEKKKANQQGYKALDDDRYQFLEICTDWDIDGLEELDDEGEPSGIAVPYVITIDRGTGKVMRRNSAASILLIIAISQVLAFMAWVLFILLVVMLGLALLLFVNWLTQGHCPICPADLRPVAQESRVMTPQSLPVNLEMWMFPAGRLKTISCRYHIRSRLRPC